MNNQLRKHADEKASTLVVTISVVAVILTLLGSAVAYTQHVSRVSERSRKAAQALEVGDGHLEFLFTNWRNISRAPGFRLNTRQPPTNFFFTESYNPGPAPTPWSSPQPSPWPGIPPAIALPAASNFPNVPNYSVSQYRIQAVTPMIELDSTEKSTLATTAHPPYAYGPNTWQYSVFYLAAVDVTIKAMTGDVTAKVRRIFEKKYDNPWTYAIFYHDDLELHPTTALSIDGPIHTNNSLYIGTSNFTARNIVSFSSEYVNGWSPRDTSSRSGNPTAPNFAKSDASLAESDCPPYQDSPYLPFGWNLKLQDDSGNVNNDSYREIIERGIATTITDDPLGTIRYYNQPGYHIVINPDNSATVTRIDSGSPTVRQNVTGNALSSMIGNNGQGTSSSALTPGRALWDAREGGAVRVVDFDVAKLLNKMSDFTGWTGLITITDAGATTYKADGSVKTAGTATNVTVSGTTHSTTKRAVRVINGGRLPTSGLTIVSENPVYIQGNFNTDNATPSYTGTPTPLSGRRQAAVIADAITVLSGAWSDSNSTLAISSRAASNTTINAAFVSGNVPSGGSTYGGALVEYSGGAENFIRFLEDWKGAHFRYWGSLVQLYQSGQAIGPWSGAGSVYKTPLSTSLLYDPRFGTSSPPGTLQIAAYLQQQRWYQVY